MLTCNNALARVEVAQQLLPSTLPVGIFDQLAALHTELRQLAAACLPDSDGNPSSALVQCLAQLDDGMHRWSAGGKKLQHLRPVLRELADGSTSRFDAAGLASGLLRLLEAAGRLRDEAAIGRWPVTGRDFMSAISCWLVQHSRLVFCTVSQAGRRCVYDNAQHIRQALSAVHMWLPGAALPACLPACLHLMHVQLSTAQVGAELYTTACLAACL